MNALIKTGSTVAVALLLASCAQTEQFRKEIATTDDTTQRLLTNLRTGTPVEVAPSQPIERIKGLWIPTRKLEAKDSSSRENKSLRRQIAFNRDFVSLQQVAERINAQSGIPVTISPEAVLASAVTSAGGPLALLPSLPNANAAVPPPLNLTTQQGSVDTRIGISYEGTIAGLLDVVAARFGVYWEWTDEDSIRFYRQTTKTFRLQALPGDTTVSTKISNATGGSSSGSNNAANGSSAQETSISSAGLSVWRGIDDSIKTMLSQTGRATVTPATGTITVTDTPQVVRMVEKFIDGQNAALSRQVVINVRVLAVELNDGGTYGINWDLVFAAASGNWGLALANIVANTDPAQSNLLMKVLPTAGGDLKQWRGSDALISAISKQGKVSLVTSASQRTINNQPAPIQVGTSRAYLASSTTTVVQGAGSTTTLQPGTFTTGFSMNTVPHIIDNNRLLLQFSIDLSSLLSLATITSGTSSIQTPRLRHVTSSNASCCVPATRLY
jgi:type IVB pilus formation R64 PilN family outer membrane protein